MPKKKFSKKKMGIIGAFFAIVAIVIAILLLSYPLIGLDKIFAIEAKGDTKL